MDSLSITAFFAITGQMHTTHVNQSFGDEFQTRPAGTYQHDHAKGCGCAIIMSQESYGRVT